MSRVFDVDGKLMEFSSSALRRVFETRKRADKTTFAAQEHSLAEALGVSDDTVHNWHYNKNGPIDIDAVKAVASALEMEDYMLLLTETDGSKKMTQLTDRQKTAGPKHLLVLRHGRSFAREDCETSLHGHWRSIQSTLTRFRCHRFSCPYGS